MIERNIFMLWNTPEEKWPELIGYCIRLWRELNPTWRLKVINGQELKSLLLEDYSAEVVANTPIQAQSDMLRAKMLREHGGIWADATCMPHMPADHWIGKYDDFEFSAVPNPRDGRPACSWFLVAKKGGAVVEAVHEEIKRYWQVPKIVVDAPSGPNAKNLELRWREFISPFAADTLRVAPYFWYHHHFQKLIDTDPAFSDAWDKVGWFPAGGWGYVQNTMKKAYAEPEIHEDYVFDDSAERADVVKFVQKTQIPCSKLNWKDGIKYPLLEMRGAIIDRAKATRKIAA
jgi:hypothetical protein